MSTYDAGIPRPLDFISKSQKDLLNNFGSANTSFDEDHYTFTTVGTNNGKHKQVTTVKQENVPTTIAAEPKLFGYEPYEQIGTIQYSRKGVNAVPTPVTYLHSPAIKIDLARNTLTPILDLSKITLLVATVYFYNSGTTLRLNEALLLKTSENFTVTHLKTPNQFALILDEKNVLNLGNFTASNLNNVFWDFKFHRIV